MRIDAYSEDAVTCGNLRVALPGRPNGAPYHLRFAERWDEMVRRGRAGQYDVAVVSPGRAAGSPPSLRDIECLAAVIGSVRVVVYLSAPAPRTLAALARSGFWYQVVQGVNDDPRSLCRVLAVFDTEGTILRVVGLRVLVGGQVPRMAGAFADGSWLVWVNSESLGGRPGEVIRTVMIHHRYEPVADTAIEILRRHTRPRFVNRVGRRVHYPFVPLTASPTVAAGDDRVFLLRGPDPEIHVRGLDGALRSLIRWSPGDARPTAPVYRRYTRESLAGITDPDVLRRYTHLYDQELPIPERLPCCQDLLVDAEGFLWVERYRLPWEEEAQWDVLAPDGRWMGTVDLPPGLQPLRVGVDHVLGRHVDELGVERIRLHRLTRTP